MSQKAEQERILLVDDNENVLAVLSDFLKSIGYAVHGARDAQRAMEAVKEELPDLALIDLRMPGMNGINLMLSLKKTKPRLPVIIYSGYPSMDTTIEALKNGADDYLPKPFFLDDLKTSIDHVLKKYAGSGLHTSSE